MNTPITFNGILIVFGTVVAIVAGITAIIAVVKWINSIHDKFQHWDEQDMKIEQLQTDINAKLQDIKTEQYVLTSCMVAVLDGLHQLGANGKVTQARESLDEYMIKATHEMKKD